MYLNAVPAIRALGKRCYHGRTRMRTPNRVPGSRTNVMDS